MAVLKALAMSATSPAVAMAVLAMTAAQPISMASQAWEGLPIPASTMIGRSISSTIILMKSLVRTPLLLPMGAPRGMMAAAPASAMERAAVRSGIMYGMGMKSSLARSSTALMVSRLSGRRYLESRMISILMKSPQPSSLASLAILSASSASLAPEVLGRSVMPLGMWSRMLPSPVELALLTARVAICTPPFSMTARVMSRENFPEPSMNLDWKRCPPITRSSFMPVAFVSCYKECQTVSSRISLTAVCAIIPAQVMTLVATRPTSSLSLTPSPTMTT